VSATGHPFHPAQAGSVWEGSGPGVRGKFSGTAQRFRGVQRSIRMRAACARALLPAYAQGLAASRPRLHLVETALLSPGVIRGLHRHDVRWEWRS
jgi:hypothetical protein